jgi:hypothetical protein
VLHDHAPQDRPTFLVERELASDQPGRRLGAPSCRRHLNRVDVGDQRSVGAVDDLHRDGVASGPRVAEQPVAYALLLNQLEQRPPEFMSHH